MGRMKPEETTPYTLTIEIARAEGAGDPHAFRCMRQDYVFRSARGFGGAEFPWDAQVLEAMAQLLRPRPDSAAMQQLGERLRTFLEQGLSTHEGWAHHEQALLQAVEAGRPVYLTFRFGAAELYSLPWELVTFLAAASKELLKERTPRVNGAELLRKTFDLDVFACVRCGGRRRVGRLGRRVPEEGCTASPPARRTALAAPLRNLPRPLRSLPLPQQGPHPAYTSDLVQIWSDKNRFGPLIRAVPSF